METPGEEGRAAVQEGTLGANTASHPVSRPGWAVALGVGGPAGESEVFGGLGADC